MIFFIIAGGSGERFWPMSRKSLPKHLIRLISEQTLIEQTLSRISGVSSSSLVYILTNADQEKPMRNALPGFPAERIIVEPVKRDTAPAAALATAIAMQHGASEVMGLFPADSVTHDVATFQRQLRDAAQCAAANDAFVTFSIPPSHPATGFGYLELGEPMQSGRGDTEFCHVNRFVEKPDRATAEQYMKSGRFGWNAGIFLGKAGLFLEEMRRQQPALADFIEQFPKDNADATWRKTFTDLPKRSLDYAIMENARSVIAARARFDWDDVGAWSSLSAHLPADEQGNTVRGTVVAHDAANNIAISNGRAVTLCGVRDLVVVETPDAVLVCHRDQVQNIKQLHDRLPDTLK